jgi:type IV pilus assembly protein PilO
MAKKRSGSSLDMLSLPGKLAVGLVIVLLAGVAYFILFYSDIDTEISNAYQTREAEKRELVNAQEAKKAYNRDIAEKTRREQLAKKQKKILPDEAESPAFLATLQTVATISGVRLTSWSPQDELPQEFYAKVPMELKLVGKFHQIAKFFHGIGQVDRIINMENITISVVQSAGQGKTGSGEDEGIEVSVQCLATAFRALRVDDGRARDPKKGGRK